MLVVSTSQEGCAFGIGDSHEVTDPRMIHFYTRMSHTHLGTTLVCVCFNQSLIKQILTNYLYVTGTIITTGLCH